MAGSTEVVPYPNPCKVDCSEVTVNVEVREPGEAVRIQVFTTAYRKVSETALATLPVGVTPVKVALRDRKGGRLSNGVYYIRVIAGAGEAVGKLAVLR
jgi:hypothetical protein